MRLGHDQMSIKFPTIIEPFGRDDRGLDDHLVCIFVDLESWKLYWL